MAHRQCDPLPFRRSTLLKSDQGYRRHTLGLQANPGGTNVEVLDEQAPDSTAVVDEAVRVFEKREVGHLHDCLVCALSSWRREVFHKAVRSRGRGIMAAS